MTTADFKPDDSFRDSIGTIDQEGKRKWIFPKKPKGKFYNYRSMVSIVLLALLFSGPFLRIGGEPVLLINVVDRKFSILGQIFWPQDFYLFVLAMLTLIVFIILFTVIFGRLFCGWVCPQTIFMEMVFRKIEYWIEGDYKHQKKLDKQPWNTEKILKKSLKQGIFFFISFLIANTFLAYIIGSEQLIDIITDPPAQHLKGLSSLVIFTLVFHFNFSWFREQACIVVCPYGRLQGVMLDRNSIVVAYDYIRGENRGKFRKKEDRNEVGKGDCIDCNQCVDVCPTGIDIRNGTQMECVNCTACIDACDFMMESVGLEKGLIRYDSEAAIADHKKWKLSVRIGSYIAVLTLLMGIFGFVLFSRNDIETTVFRTPGMLYQQKEDNRISNLYNIKVINKTNKPYELTLKLLDIDGEITFVGGSQELSLEAHGLTEGVAFILIDAGDLKSLKTPIEIGVYHRSELMETVETNFMGPVK